MKNLWFQLHWLLGITAGIVLAVVGVTGAMLSFEHEIKVWLNPGVMTVTPGAQQMLAPPELLARVQAAQPERRITALTVQADPEAAAQVTFAPKPGDSNNRRGEQRYVDPYTGVLLGQPQGMDFFRTTMQIHRWLAAGDTGKAIVGASTVALIVLSLSGLYLRWPRRRSLNWRAWLTFDPRRSGRSLLWDLHAVAGTWALLFYLLASLTGLYWSYDWYRDALFTITGAPRPQQQAGAPKGNDGAARGGRERGERQERGAAPAQNLELVWSTFIQTVPGYSSATLRLPQRPGQTVQVSYLDPDPAHERARNTLEVEPASGAVGKHERYADKPPGAKLMSSIFVLHAGSFFGLPGTILMMLASLAMPLFAITGWMLYLDRRRKKKAVRAARREGSALVSAAAILPQANDGEWLIGFASQTGSAEQVAWQSAGMLRSAGVAVNVQPLGRIDAAHLHRARHALFVVSTFGTGEAPDHARSFARLMRQAPALNDLRFGLLALGSRQYDSFCGFGRALDEWLCRHGARPLFDRIEVDNGDPRALQQWQAWLSRLTGAATPAAQDDGYANWTLARRHVLNPGSAGQPTVHLVLTPPPGMQPQWQAGDLVDVRPCQPGVRVNALLRAAGLDANTVVRSEGRSMKLADALAHKELPPTEHWGRIGHAQHLVDTLAPVAARQYSIASIPQDGALELVVRQVGQGVQAGVASAWLGAELECGGPLALRVRSNSNFHLADADTPLILIGNGTGIAGLRAHLKARAAQGRGRNWLLFGERNAACDYYFENEIAHWRRTGILERVDLAFSRDQSAKIYVQDRLREHGRDVHAWLAAGASILVCGSLEGMAPGVHAVLTEVIGTEALEALAAAGRYRRDVY